VAEPPPWGWLATPWAMGVVRPPPDRGPRGPATPYGVVRPPLFFFFFFFHRLKGVARPPPWPKGHPFKSMKKKKKKRGVAEPPHRGWLAALWAMGVVRPPPDRGPRGASHPLWGGSATPLFFSFFFFHRLKGVARPPP
jgi:hypothetical protein